MNCFIATGRLCQDNVMRMTASGKEVLNNTIAVKRDFKNANGEYDSDFINVIFFGTTAKYIGEYAPKGSMIEIRGRWQHRAYQNKEGGTSYTDECVVENASILISNKPTEAPTNQAAQSTQQATQSNPFGDPSYDDLPF